MIASKRSYTNVSPAIILLNITVRERICSVGIIMAQVTFVAILDTAFTYFLSILCSGKLKWWIVTWTEPRKTIWRRWNV